MVAVCLSPCTLCTDNRNGRHGDQKEAFVGSIEGRNSARYWTAAAYKVEVPTLQVFNSYSALHAG